MVLKTPQLPITRKDLRELMDMWEEKFQKITEGVRALEIGTHDVHTHMDVVMRENRTRENAQVTTNNIAKATALKIDLVTPVFQPLRAEAGRIWYAIEYGITTDNSSLMSSESAAEREDNDEEIMSFDLGPEPFDPLVQDRLPSDEYLDDWTRTNTWGFGTQSDGLRFGNA